MTPTCIQCRGEGVFWNGVVYRTCPCVAGLLEPNEHGDVAL